MTSSSSKTSRKPSHERHHTVNNATTPLDLRKSPGNRSTDSPSGHTDDESILPDRNTNSPALSDRSPSQNRATPDPNSLKQKEIEAQLHFLKAKQVKIHLVAINRSDQCFPTISALSTPCKMKKSFHETPHPPIT